MEIKFRKYNHSRMEMVYSEDLSKGLESYFANCDGDKFGDDMQFTGCVDSRGADIYVGAIIEWFGRNLVVEFGECDVSISGVTFDISTLAYHIGGMPLSLDVEYKVLGNVDQTPELLNA